jgi:ligand-binding SRPBCC domain-containing protein
MIFHFQAEQWVPVPLEQVFSFFANPANLPRIMPRRMHVRLEHLKIVAPLGREQLASAATGRPALAGAGSELEASYRPVPFLPLRIRSVAVITRFAANSYFEDVQGKGPFKSWHHRHEFAAEEKNGVRGTIIRDRVEYQIGFGMLGSLINAFLLAPQLRRTFAFRQKALEKLL